MIGAYGLSIPESLKEVCDPSRSALIIYDMQVGIVSQVSEGPQIVERCAKLLAAARTRSLRVIFTRHFFLPNQAAGVGQIRRAMIWQRQPDPHKLKPIMAQGSSSFQIVEQLEPREGEVLSDKVTMSAFESTFLNIALRDTGLNTFLIAGIAMEVGIEPTVRHGLDLNFVPVVVTDACGSRSAELKERSLSTLEQTGEVVLATTEEVVAALAAN